MHAQKMTADRLATFSDAVFAVIVTIMVLELKAPVEPSFSALGPLWPTAISYVVSYMFVAIIWINHHYLMRFAGPPTLKLIWINFVHLFMVSLLPFATAWIARTRLAASAVVFYAGLFVCIDIAYNIFEREILARADVKQGVRSYTTYSQTPVADCPRKLYHRHAGCIRCAAPRFWPDMLRPCSPLAA